MPKTSGVLATLGLRHCPKSLRPQRWSPDTLVKASAGMSCKSGQNLLYPTFQLTVVCPPGRLSGRSEMSRVCPLSHSLQYSQAPSFMSLIPEETSPSHVGSPTAPLLRTLPKERLVRSPLEARQMVPWLPGVDRVLGTFKNLLVCEVSDF